MISLIVPPKVRQKMCAVLPGGWLLILPSPILGSDLPCLRHVDAGVRYCVQHQVPGQPIVRTGRDHQHTTEVEVVQSCSTKRPGLVRRDNLDR